MEWEHVVSGWNIGKFVILQILNPKVVSEHLYEWIECLEAGLEHC